MCDSDHSAAIDWGVMGRDLRHSRGSRVQSVSGECQPNEELTRAQKRCAGESMADEAAHLWSVAELVRLLSCSSSEKPTALAAASRSPAISVWFRRKIPAESDAAWDTSANRATPCYISCWWKLHRSRYAAILDGVTDFFTWPSGEV